MYIVGKVDKGERVTLTCSVCLEYFSDCCSAERDGKGGRPEREKVVWVKKSGTLVFPM